ncbi:glycosyltransferase [Dichotomopilus funicola]|uniref:Glycosyltransferase n=1 Tax=Dichotomopilus funicola TaxID=1934379 RepID=A0AAN6ZHU9_9PEZI|nr:glycosyltransferase [Dichotomopilus funicola]
MSRRTRHLWRWARAVAVFALVWLVLITAHRDDGSLNPFSPSTWTTSHDTDPLLNNLCRSHGWQPYRPSSSSSARPPRRKVYDLMMINTELDHLEIRLNTTWHEVDYYILVESRQTFTSRPKPLTLLNNYSLFAPYHSKMIYHEIQYPPHFRPRTPWDMEDLQRNSMLTQVFPLLTGDAAPNKGDVLVVSDVDEIPRPSTLRTLRACAFPRRLTLASRFYYYSFQWLHRGPEWPHPQATYYQGLHNTLRPNDLRIADGGMWPFREWEKGTMANASWHCSSCFATVGELLGKMASFSHTSMNQERYRDAGRIVEYVRRGKDLWDRKGEVYDRVEGNGDVPGFLLENRERFGYMLDRDGEKAGFRDYGG